MGKGSCMVDEAGDVIDVFSSCCVRIERRIDRLRAMDLILLCPKNGA